MNPIISRMPIIKDVRKTPKLMFDLHKRQNINTIIAVNDILLLWDVNICRGNILKK